jgi:hypothetical protein
LLIAGSAHSSGRNLSRILSSVLRFVGLQGFSVYAGVLLGLVILGSGYADDRARKDTDSADDLRDSAGVIPAEQRRDGAVKRADGGQDNDYQPLENIVYFV